ncbi:MAG: 5'-methylthioadenosine/adenosylhomocysteine nucleosidase [Bacteroidales bacterium]|nr:5'-methylthioadenosine/adenosylhomocysteine nucleosidase [Bacteroidales bacterium]
MKVGILSAMTKEHNQLVGLLETPVTEHEAGYDFIVGTLGKNTLILLQCGLGKVNAAVGAALLIRRYEPDCVVSTGCAGGIDESLKVMDVVVSTATMYHDVSIPGSAPGQIQGLPERFRSEEQLIEVACSGILPTKDTDVPRIVGGLICTGDQFISDQQQLAAIKAHFPEALAVDMESAAIAQTCYLLKTPFVSFRILSDTPGADNHIAQYNNFWDEMASRSFDVTRRFLAALPERFAILPFKE